MSVLTKSQQYTDHVQGPYFVIYKKSGGPEVLNLGEMKLTVQAKCPLTLPMRFYDKMVTLMSGKEDTPTMAIVKKNLKKSPTKKDMLKIKEDCKELYKPKKPVKAGKKSGKGKTSKKDKPKDDEEE